jgi:hypothetical protein
VIFGSSEEARPVAQNTPGSNLARGFVTASIRPIQLAKASSVKNWAKTFQPDPNPLKLNSKTGPLDDGLSDFLPTFCAHDRDGLTT